MYMLIHVHVDTCTCSHTCTCTCTYVCVLSRTNEHHIFWTRILILYFCHIAIYFVTTHARNMTTLYRSRTRLLSFTIELHVAFRCHVAYCKRITKLVYRCQTTVKSIMRNKQPFDACSDFYVNSRCYIVNFLMLLAESHSKYDHSFSPFSIVMNKKWHHS